MFNWVYRVLMLVMFCGLGVMFYVNRVNYTLDQFGFFACVWLCIIGVFVFLRDVADDLKVGRLVDAETEKKLWQDRWLEERENVRNLENKRCPRAGGWLVREWPGYFLRDDSDLRCDDVTGETEEAYSLFRIEPYGRVEVFVGKLGWVLGQCERAIAQEKILDEKAVELSNDSKSVELKLADKIMECAFLGVGDVDLSKVYSGNHDLVNEIDDVPDNLLHHFMDLTGINDMTIDEFKTSGVTVGVIDTGGDSMVGGLTRKNFVDGCRIMKDIGGVTMVDHFIKPDGIEPGEVVAHVPPLDGGKVHQFSMSVGPLVIDTRGLEVLGKMVEVEKPTAYDPLIGDTGTVMVPVNNFCAGESKSVDAVSVDGRSGSSVEELEVQTDCWAAMGELNRVRAEDDGVFEQEHQNEVPVDRCKFLDLPVGSKFRYDNLATVFVKLNDLSQRGEKIGLITKFEGFDVPKFIETGDYLGCDQVFCAADTVEACESLVVCIVE